jgi:hypothetical protein
VAVTVVNTDDADRQNRERRIVLAGSAFLALIDAFFVSLVALTGGAGALAGSSLVMAIIGLFITSRLIARAVRAGNYSRGFPTRNINFAFSVLSVGGYSVQLGLAVAFLVNDHSSALQRALVLVIVEMYVSALWRSWEVLGVGRSG